MTKLIILRGYPGSGKTTIGAQLAAAGIGQFIDHNAVLTFVAGISGDDEGIYNEIAQLELAICKKLLAEGKTVIVARGFSSLSNLVPYENVASELNLEIEIIRLEVREEVLIRRVQSPERKLDFNPTIDELHAVTWMRENPIQDHPREISIDNNKPLEDVVNNLKAIL